MKTWILVCLGVMLLVALTSARRGGRGGGRRGGGGSHGGRNGSGKPCLVEEITESGETNILKERDCPTGLECNVNGGEGGRFVGKEDNHFVTFCSDVIQGPPCFIDRNDDSDPETFPCPRIDSSEETSEEDDDDEDEETRPRSGCDRQCKLKTVGQDGSVIRYCLQRAPQPENPEAVRAEADRAEADDDDDDEDSDSDSRGDRRGRSRRPSRRRESRRRS